MNITSFAEYIELFNKTITESGFHRDLQDYTNSLANNRNNIVALRNIANKIYLTLEKIYAGDLPDSLEKLFVTDDRPFTEELYDDKFSDLIKDPKIELADFYEKLDEILSDLESDVAENINKISSISKFIEPFLSKQEEFQSDKSKAIISILFKDKKTITILKEFTRNIQSWNKILPIYHQLLKSSSPEDIEIITVQNGSIDFLVNFDFDIAIDLTELFKVGFKCFMAYLSYKKMAKPLVESYFGNKKLIAMEKEREAELINNIGEAVKNKAIEQHSDASKKDKKIEKNGDKKIEQVVKLVTSHILKGNDIKLLSIPVSTDETDKEKDKKEELRSISSQVRQALKIIPPKEMKVLLEKYTDPDDEINLK